MVNTNPINPYKDQYLIYSRKSTDDYDNQKNSLAYQVGEGIKYAKKSQLRIASVDIAGFCTAGQIKEKHTAFKEDDNFTIDTNGRVSYKIERPKFFQLIKYLNEGYFKGVIFLCWDRASRNKNDDNILRKLIKNKVDIRFVQTDYADSSAGELHMAVDGAFSQHYSRLISEKVSNQARKLRDDGVCIYKAPVGYLNQGNSAHKPFDPVRAPLIKVIFEKYAEGTWSLAELAKWANAQGLVMPLMRRRRTPEEMLSDDDIVIEPVARPLTFNHLNRILRNRFYTGKIVDKSNNAWIPSVSHKGLISEELFNKVQMQLRSKNVSVHYVSLPEFSYRGMVRCTDCRRVYTPYEKKRINYYGVRCKQDCTNTKKSINTHGIEEKVGEVISRLSFTEDELIQINASVKTVKIWEEKRHEQLGQVERKSQKIQADLIYLRDNKLSLLKSTVYTPESFLLEELKLNEQLESFRNEKDAVNVSIIQVLKDLVILSELLKNVYLYYYFGISEEKKPIIQKVFSELNLSEGILTYKAKNGFRFLERSNFPIGGQTTWISEVVSNHHLIQESIDDLQNLPPPTHKKPP